MLRDVLPIRSLDPVVIAKALELGAVLVSLNGDFTDIVAVQLHNHPEIIPQLMERLAAFLGGHRDQKFYHRKLFLVEVHRVRIRQ